ncbi:hypothetical protein EI94DRAFT_1696183 [Lactarius quietus]|nr:hypothetical protein EI94DRAFT_1696183 [Lactarius quietus]
MKRSFLNGLPEVRLESLVSAGVFSIWVLNVVNHVVHKTWDIEDDYESKYIGSIYNNIPRTAYKYVETGLDTDDNPIMVFVLEDGFDRAALETTTVNSDGFPKGSFCVLTLGVWPSVHYWKSDDEE